MSQECVVLTSSAAYQECIDACNACAIACNACFAACLAEEDPKMMARCIALDADCAAICSLAASAMARNSEMAQHFCRICSEVCLACANECEHHDDEHCQRCAAACRVCAKACLTMSNGHS
ncbi:four-helix bundle copper-binding protein [Comamonas sp.]